MKWTKRGRIFNPTEFRLANGCVEFAQSPQALVFADFVRIYFSTRSREAGNGKYRSHIAFVDFRKDLHTIVGVSQHTVIELGRLGCFDEHGIFPINVLRLDGSVHAYTCGWSRRSSVSVETAIGMAISSDNGHTFQKKTDGPILAASLHEPSLVGDPFVRKIGDEFHMWRIFGTGWKEYGDTLAPDRTYKIGHARSKDGIRWVKEDGLQIIADKLGAQESQALPTVFDIGNRHHMLFCYRQSFDFRKNRDRSYRIGHAWSDDLTNWRRDDKELGLEVGVDAWDSDMLCYPHVFECDDKLCLLYNGNEFGRYGFGLAVLE